MAKKQVIPVAPDECCGVCRFSRDEQGDLVCYANPPVLIPDENGAPISHRGGEVFPQDPICKDFQPRMHS